MTAIPFRGKRSGTIITHNGFGLLLQVTRRPRVAPVVRRGGPFGVSPFRYGRSLSALSLVRVWM